MSTDATSIRPLQLSIDGMSCGHCVAAVREALADLPDVEVRNVAVGAATVALAPDGATTPEAVLDAVREAGYEARLAPRGLPQL